MDTSNAMDWVFILAVFQLFGMRYLMAGTDGQHLSVDISLKKRKAGLVIGMGIIWVPFLLVWIVYGHSPSDMWNGATAWWQADVGLVGWAVAIAGWWLLLSPLQAVLAIWLIHRATVREQLQQRPAATY